MKRLLSITMLLFFMMGQVNLAWATHYCGDQLMSSEVSLAPEKSNCCGDEVQKEMDCCEDDVTVVDADDFFGKSEVKINLVTEFVVAYALIFASLNTPSENLNWVEKRRQHPEIPDLTLLYQSFLI